MSEMTTRERIMAACDHKAVDHVPLCVDGAVCHGKVFFVSDLHPDPFERARFYMDLGLDTGIRLSVPWSFPEDVKVKEWREEGADGNGTLLHKEYVTPRGTLEQVVRKTEDYPRGPVPLFSDHLVPSARSKKHLVSTEEDIEKLECLFQGPSATAIDRFRREAKPAREFCDEHQIVLSASSRGVGDPVIWMSGVENALIMAMTEKDAFRRYVEIVSDRQLRVSEAAIDAGVDFIVRRGWYESTDFWSPDLYREFFLGPLAKQVTLAHQAGVRLTYIMNSGAMPLLGFFKEIGFDVYSNIDPMAAGTDLAKIKREVGDQIALCGGLNNNLVIERGTEGEVEAAVAQAMETLAPGSGFILAPGDALLSTDEITKRNFYKMIETWRSLR